MRTIGSGRAARKRGPALAAACAALLLASLASHVAAAEAGGASSPEAVHQGVPDVYDPYEGMDPDGRIPSVEKPADLPNPERWRYIPEGRIKPGNFFDRFLVTSFVVPIVFRNSDTGVGGGLGVTDIDFRAQRRREFAGLFLAYTEKGQQSYWGLWRRWLHHREVPGGGVLQEERSFVGVSGGYQKTLTRRFFGYGADSKEDDETRYVDELFELELELEMAIPEPGADLVGTLGLRGEFHELSTNDLCHYEYPNPVECSGQGENEAFRRFIEARDDERLGYLTAGLRFDTRDSQRNPYEGFEVGALVEAPLVQNGGDVGARFTLNGSTALRVPGIFHRGGEGDEEHPPTDTIALGVATWIGAGDLPFTARPTLGGALTLRGYVDGRFRDDAAWHAAIEHRIWVIPRGFEVTPTIRVERIGIAPFFELGTVGKDGIDMFENEVRYSYGIGLRVLLERAAPFRVDFGFSPEGFNWSARFGYSF